MTPTLPRTVFVKPALILAILLLLMGLPGSWRLLNLLRPTAKAAAIFTVSSTGDLADSAPGDGACNDGAGACTLRAAIQEANALAGDDAITFSSNLNNSTITLDSALPDINGNVTITGPGPGLLTVGRSTAPGTPNFRILTINLGQTVVVSGLTITNGNVAGGSFPANSGGGIFNDGTLTLNSCVLSGNIASESGGGAFNRGGLLTINGSTISNNASASTGAGVINTSSDTTVGTLTINSSTISNNVCGNRGGGIYNFGFANVTNSTISSNSAVMGGGIFNVDPLTLIDVTVTANNASSSGGGINNPGIGAVMFGNSIFAGNTSPSGPDCSGFNLSSQDYNLIGNTSGGNFTGTTTHNVINVNALLGPLAANGGPTSTHALLVGSPAIDAGNSSRTSDQRGQPRPVDDQTVVNATGGNATDIGAYEAHNLQVNSTADTDDGLCRALGTGNGCTLREAISAANAEVGAELITFAPALTNSGPATITLSNVLPDIMSDLTIQGPAGNLLKVMRSTAGGSPNFRIFFINSGTTVNLLNLTIVNGTAPNGFGGGVLNNAYLVMTNCNLYGNNATLGAGGAVASGIANTGSSLVLNNSNIGGLASGQPNLAGVGGGIFINSGTLTMTGGSVVGNSNQGIRLISGPVVLNSVAITNNTAAGDAGGGILAGGVTLDIFNCLIAGNNADVGGGIFSNVSTVTLINSTVSGNSSLGVGGGIDHQSGTIRLINSTLTNNRSDSDNSGNEQGGGIIRLDGTATLKNTIVAGNFVGAGTIANDINGTVDPSSSFNLIGTGGSGGLGNGVNNNQVGIADPTLGPLANNGGLTLTHALLPGSLALDAGDNCVVNNACSPALGYTLTTDQRGAGFNRAADGNGDGSSTVDIGAFEVQSIVITNTNDSGAGSLRQAIADANVNPGVDAINFQTGLTGTITLLSALPDLSTSMDINGPGATQLTIQRSTAGGTPNFRIFTINPGKNLSISGLTISNGNPVGSPFPNNAGGGVLNDGGTLTLTNCTVTNNSAVNGGGISNSGTLVVVNSDISSNTAGAGGGGGIESNATLTVSNSRISGNTVTDGGIGGGIEHIGISLTVSNSTISNNTGSLGGGIHSSGLNGATISNSTITGNGADQSSGGIHHGRGHLIVSSCNISGNSGTVGGGLAISGLVTAAVTNTTISGNVATNRGGGIQNSGTTTITNCTISGNTVPGFLSGGGITNDPTGTMNIRNTIVANSGPSGNCFRTATSQGHNLSDDNSCAGTFNQPGDFNNVPALLGPLQNNGGFTQSVALLAGSPALDGADDCITQAAHCGDPNIPQLTTDQRGLGFSRIVDGPDADTTDAVDIGAFEAQVSVADTADQSINEDSALVLFFHVGGAASITSVTATSSNTALAPNNPANVEISGSGSTRRLLITPVANASGTSTITVTVNGNNSQSMTDTFVLTVNPVNDAPSFTKGSDQTVNENDGAQTVNNWASNISAGPADESGQSLTFMISNNSNAALFAVAPAISSSGTLTYAPATGMSGTATITIALEDNGGTANGGSNTSASQSFNINVREGGTLAFSAALLSAAEDSGNSVITVSRTGGSAGEARVDYATSNGTATAGQDYTPASGTLIFPDGVTSKTFNVAITNDAIDEPDETINLTLTAAAGSGSLGTPAGAALTITDNDPTPGLSINDVSVTEGNSGTANAVFTVTLSGQSSQTVTVNFATANGTASAGSDYTATSGTLTFLPLETTKPVTVSINGDVTFERNETFSVELTTPENATISDGQGIGTITNDDAQGGFISFSQANYTVGENGGFITITVNRSNDLSGPATVDYATAEDSSVVPCATANGIASSRCDFTTAVGSLHFAAGESSKSFPVLISQDNFVERPETLTLTLSNLSGGAAFATPSTATLTITDDASEPAINPIDTAEAFVRQHYHDFLNREPDASGLAFWSNQITECQQPGATCDAAVRRINVSAAFFLSIEFQETGYFVYRTYKASYGNLTGTPVPLRLAEFLPDTQQIGKDVIVGQPGAEQQLENNKVAYALDFVSRARFTNAYPTTLTPPQFVDMLFTNAGVTPSTAERNAAIAEFGGVGNVTGDVAARARALRRVAENSTLKQQETNKAFVLMQYFGYLRRNPNDPPEANLDFGGYNFWLGKLNEFNGNFVNAEMVKAFIVSGEYRQRFGQ